MKKLKFLAITILLILAVLILGYKEYHDRGDRFNRAYGLIATADIRPMLSFLESVSYPKRSLFIELSEKYNRRFIEQSNQFDFEDPFISKIHQSYANYWRTSLLNPKEEQEARNILYLNLYELIKEEGIEFLPTDTRKIEASVKEAAEKRGYKILLGQTQPLRELMIWRKEKRVAYDIELPNETFSANVVFLQDFLCKGWHGFATFDESHTGGWAKNGLIYRVGPKPKKENEWFRVTILAHEGRHVLDIERYGHLDQRVLEYRAKLTELILAKKIFHTRLYHFQNEAKEDESAPHAYASFQLIRDMKLELNKEIQAKSLDDIHFEDFTVKELKEVAEVVLDENTRALEPKG